MSEPPRVVHGARAGRGLSTARSVLQVLTLLAEHPDGVTAWDVAQRVGKSTSTAYYLLASLCEEGFAVRQGSGRYQLRHALGPPVEDAPAAAAAGRQEAALDELYVRTRKRVYLGHLRAGAIEMVAVRGRQGLPCMPGLGTRIERDAMHALAMGKVVLSLLGAEARERYARGPLPAYTAATITSPEALLAELDTVRDRGVAVEREEFSEDFCCVAAPMFDARGRFEATIGLSVTARGFDLERDALIAAVRDAGRSSNDLRKTDGILPVAEAVA
jgi:DNA-binding IclR family transcriptional regulator